MALGECPQFKRLDYNGHVNAFLTCPAWQVGDPEGSSHESWGGPSFLVWTPHITVSLGTESGSFIVRSISRTR